MAETDGKNKLSVLWTKIKGIKNIRLIIGIIIAALLMLLYFNYSAKKSETANTTENSEETATEEVYTDYEKKLAAVLSQIDGVGKTNVMITYDSDGKEVIGVIVVAEGADDPLTEIRIRRAVATALKIGYNGIEVYSMS
jgi:flagellar basal body-associated protein FliL